MPFISSKKLQAIQEGERQLRSILTAPSIQVQKSVRKNQYITYQEQIIAIDDKYNCIADYGSGIVPTIIDTRTDLIAGEGVNINTQNEQVKEWIKNFCNVNKIETKILDMVQISEMEGRCLIVLYIEGDQVKIKLYRHLISQYQPDCKNGELVNISMTDKDGNAKKINKDVCVYIKTGGVIDRPETPPRIASILTQIDNYERALYDMRESNHLFGFPTPAFETSDPAEAATIRNWIQQTKWKIGNSFIGGAKMYYPQPPNSYESLTKEMSLNLKIISSRTGIPVHWLGWTDLMSNRATAEELQEFISTGTKKERLIWRCGVKELIVKAMALAYDYGLPGALYMPDDFTVDMPDISLSKIEALNNTWLPLQQAGVISMDTMRNMIPGINPLEESSKDAPDTVGIETDDIISALKEIE